MDFPNRTVKRTMLHNAIDYAHLLKNENYCTTSFEGKELTVIYFLIKIKYYTLWI